MKKCGGKKVKGAWILLPCFVFCLGVKGHWMPHWPFILCGLVKEWHICKYFLCTEWKKNTYYSGSIAFNGDFGHHVFADTTSLKIGSMCLCRYPWSCVDLNPANMGLQHLLESDSPSAHRAARSLLSVHRSPSVLTSPELLGQHDGANPTAASVFTCVFAFHVHRRRTNPLYNRPTCTS